MGDLEVLFYVPFIGKTHDFRPDSAAGHSASWPGIWPKAMRI